MSFFPLGTSNKMLIELAYTIYVYFLALPVTINIQYASL
jgi:hypothetical protein